MKAFECRMCGNCCYGEGGIFLEEKQPEQIARFLGIAAPEFVDQYCEERHGRHYIKTGPDKRCLFYNEKESCLIHPVKPARCNLWPFYPAIMRDEDGWKEAQDACPGINPDCSFEEFVRQSGK